MDPQTTSDYARKKRKVSPSASPSRNEEDATPDPPQKSLQFWFGDGNIILQTQTIQYRIHRGVLSFQSSMFENMFAMPQPEQSAQLSLQGCPVVPVTDSAEDWDALLGLLYNMERYIPNTHILPLETMLAMVRLGHKYDFARFKAEGLRQLGVIFSKDQCLRDRFFADPLPEANIIKGHEFKTLQAIEDLHIQSALPLAYFICISDRTLEEIIAGRDTPDGPVFLSQHTKNVLTLGKQQFIATCPSLAYQWLSAGKPSAECANTVECMDEILKLLAGLLKDPTDLRLIDILFRRRDIFQGSDLCDSCQDEGLIAFERVSLA